MEPDYEQLTRQLDGGVLDEAMRNNMAYLQAVVGGTELVLAHPLNFDPRADYWHPPERRFFVQYFANRYRKWPKGPARDLLAKYALSVSKFVDELRQSGRIDYCGVNYGEAGGLKAVLQPLRQALPELPPVEGWADIRGSRDQSASAVQSLELFLDDVVSEGFGSNSKPLGPTMRWFGFLGVKTLDEAEERQAFFFAFSHAVTATNAYRRAGAQVFGPMVGNTATNVFIDALRAWREGTALEEAPLFAMAKEHDTPVDTSSYNTIRELWGLLNLEREPFYNSKVVSYLEDGESPEVATGRIGQATRTWLQSRPEVATRLSEKFLAALATAQRTSTKPFAFARRHNKRVMTDPLDARLDAQLKGAARARLESKSELDRAAMLLHLAMDSAIYQGLGDSPPEPKPSEPDGTPPKGAVDTAALLSGEHRVWLYAPGNKGTNWSNDLPGETASVGWSELDDFTSYKSKEAILEALQEHQDGDAKPTNSAKCCWDFGHEVEVGDTMVARGGRSVILGIGTVVTPYTYDPSDEAFPHKLGIKWQWSGSYTIEDKNTLPMQTLVNASARTALWRELRERVFHGEAPTDPPPGAGGKGALPYSVSDALADLFCDRDFVLNAKGLLARKKNLILQGPPGVGKTFFARRLAFLLMGEQAGDRLQMVQFHQAYTYEHFVRGFIPKEGGGFGVRNGTLYKLAETAKADPDNAYVLIIDEINRGNLSKIFGETLMLVEADKRDAKWAVGLGYGDDTEGFYLPPNLHVIGTMNTADRSLALVDYALRRRFVFLQLKPNFGHPRFAEHLAGLPKGTAARIRTSMAKLNAMVAQDLNLGSGFEIGHSYFCLDAGDMNEEATAAWLRQIIDYELLPMVNEYWFDDPSQRDAATKILGELLP